MFACRMGAALFRHRLAVMALLFATPLLVGLVLKRVLHTETLAVAKTPVLLATALLMLLAFALAPPAKPAWGRWCTANRRRQPSPPAVRFPWTRHPLYWGTGLFAVALGHPRTCRGGRSWCTCW